MNISKLCLLLIAVSLAACGQKTATPEPAATVAAPAASVATPAPAAAPTTATAAPVMATASAADLAKGEQIYTASCLSCHDSGLLGAPKFGDKTAWAPRIAKGSAELHANALNGFKTMPAKGGNVMLKDDEVKASVDYMVSKAL